MKSKKRYDNQKKKNFEVTPDILKKLQDSLNDNIKPDFKEKTDDKKKVPNKKRKPSNRGVERNKH